MDDLSVSHVKIMLTGIYQKIKTLVATVEPSELLGPPGSRLL